MMNRVAVDRPAQIFYGLAEDEIRAVENSLSE